MSRRAGLPLPPSLTAGGVAGQAVLQRQLSSEQGACTEADGQAWSVTRQLKRLDPQRARCQLEQEAFP